MTSINAAAPSQNVYASALVTGLPLSPASIMTLLRRRMQDMDGQVDAIMSEIDTNTARSENLQRQVEALSRIRAAAANAQTNANAHVKYGDINVTFEGESMTAAELIERVGIQGAPIRAMEDFDLEATQGEVTVLNNRIRALESLTPTVMSQLSESQIRALGIGGGVDRNGAIAELTRERDELQGKIDRFNTPGPDDQFTGQTLDNFLESIKSQARRANSGNEVLMVRLQSVMQQRSQTVTMATQMMKSITDSEKAVASNIGR